VLSTVRLFNPLLIVAFYTVLVASLLLKYSIT
jgi:hypothetical protein